MSLNRRLTADSDITPFNALLLAELLNPGPLPLSPLLPQQVPPALTPLAGTPLIDYHIEAARVGGVEELTIMSYASAKHVLHHLERRYDSIEGRTGELAGVGRGASKHSSSFSASKKGFQASLQWRRGSEHSALWKERELGGDGIPLVSPVGELAGGEGDGGGRTFWHHGMRIVFRQGTTAVTSFPSAIADIKNRNLFPEAPLLLLSLETIVCCEGLRKMFYAHTDRCAKKAKTAVTMLLASNRAALQDAHRAAHQAAVPSKSERKPMPAEGMGENAASALSPFVGYAVAPHVGMGTSPHDAVCTTQRRSQKTFLPSSLPQLSVAFHPPSSIVHTARFWECSNECSFRKLPHLELDLTLEGDGEVCVRSDLVFTSALLLSSDALSLITPVVSTPSAFVQMLLLPDAPLPRTVAIEILPNSSMACPVLFRGATCDGPVAAGTDGSGGVRTYLDAHAIVADRLLFPLTPECDFCAWGTGGVHVSTQCPTVYLPNLRHHVATLRGKVWGGSVVAGGGVVLEASSEVFGSYIGKEASVGRGSVVTGSVLWEGVRVAEDVRVERAVVGPHAELGRGVVVGEYSVLDASVVLPDLTVVPPFSCVRRASEGTEAGGSAGCKYTISPMRDTGALTSMPLIELFLNDAPCAVDDSELTVDAAVQVAMDRRLQRLIVHVANASLAGESSVSSTVEVVATELQNVRRDYQVDNEVFVRWLTSRLLQHVHDRAIGGSENAGVATERMTRERIDAAYDLLERVLKAAVPLYRRMISGDAASEEAVLFGYCEGLWRMCDGAAAGEAGSIMSNSIFSKRPKKVLAALYCSSNKSAFERDGYCVVSAETILRFDEMIQDLMEHCEGEERLVCCAWQKVRDYVEKVRASL